MLVVTFLELLQFNIIPYFDGALYYGSFVKSINSFRLDLFSYVGSFVCWKSIHGLALFLSPIEFWVQGRCLGVHLGNLVITMITIYILNKLLKKIFVDITSLQSALFCFCFVVFPYELGMFTYFSTDFQLAFLSIWLIYSVYEKNDLLISFSGFMLSFTKDTGAIFYVVFLVSFVIVDLVTKNGIKRIVLLFMEWMELKRTVLWITPTICYLFMFKFRNYFSNQVFAGESGSDVFGLKTGYALSNHFLQTFVFGFRWLIIVGVIITFLICQKRKIKCQNISQAGKKIMFATFFANFAIFIMLAYLRGMTECPRYTAIFNSIYIFGLIYISQNLFQRISLKNGIIIFFASIFLIQTYWSIDPSLINNYSIEIGKKRIYKYIAKGDDRPIMKIGDQYGVGECLTDCFTGNYEYTFYSSLFQRLLIRIDPIESINFYVLDLCDYELQICGNYNYNYQSIDVKKSRHSYDIYWDKKHKKRTFQWNQDCIKMYETSILTSQLEDSEVKKVLPKDFYMLVVYRVDDKDAVNNLKRMGYIFEEEIKVSNIYGELSALHFVLKE